MCTPHLQGKGSSYRTVWSTSKLFTYLESSFTVLKSILNNQSIILDGLIRKTLQNFTNFIARTKSTKFRNRLKTCKPHPQGNGSSYRTVCFTSKLFTYSESSYMALNSILNNQSIIVDGLVRKRLQSLH